MSTSLLEMNHIKKEFDGLGVLKDISLSVEEGEIVSIIGPSGSGKSTMLRCATMLEEIDGGEILYMGKKAAWVENGKVMHPDKKEMKEIRSCFGLVFQNFNLLPKLSAQLNVALPLVYAGIGEEERLERAKTALEAVGLGDRIDHNPTEMSGGQRQRVAIARALINDPAIIMADEPTGNLDTKSSYEIMDIFKKMNDNGKTVVMVTHEPDIAEQTKRILTMRDGKLVSDEWRADHV